MKILTDIKRVWKVTRKPNKEEYLNTLKIVVIGFLILGSIGFIIDLIWVAFLSRFFS